MTDPGKLVVSSTEPEMLKGIADVVSTEPEKFGVDFMWHGSEGKLWGVQRKTVNDLLQSLFDGRIQMELQQMSAVDYPFLIIEGTIRPTTDGMILKDYGPDMSVEQWRSLTLSIDLLFNVRVYPVATVTDTINTIKSFVAWSMKEEHSSLLRRPAMKSTWGTADSRDYLVWLLQSVPGVGYKTAETVITALGTSPYRMRVTRDDLLEIEGVGPKTADAIIAAVQAPTPKRKRRRKQ